MKRAESKETPALDSLPRSELNSPRPTLTKKCRIRRVRLSEWLGPAVDNADFT